MVTKKEGPLARLAKRLGLGKTSVGGGRLRVVLGLLRE